MGTCLGSAEDEPEDLRGGQHVAARVADAPQLDQPVPGGEPGRPGKPADVLVVVQAAVESPTACTGRYCSSLPTAKAPGST